MTRIALQKSVLVVIYGFLYHVDDFVAVLNRELAVEAKVLSDEEQILLKSGGRGAVGGN